MMWIFGGKLSVRFRFSQEKEASILLLETSPHSSLQAKKFVTWNSLWEHPRLTILKTPNL